MYHIMYLHYIILLQSLPSAKCKVVKVREVVIAIVKRESLRFKMHLTSCEEVKFLKSALQVHS